MEDKQSFSTILFDWDGCLVNSLKQWSVSYQTVYQRYGILFSQEDFKKRILGDCPVEFDVTDADAFIKELCATVAQWMPTVSLHPYAFEVLSTLHQKEKTTAIVTSSSREVVAKAAQNLGIDRFIKTIVGMEDVVEFKPDPEGIEKAIAFLEAQKEETVMVGDSGKDVAAGKNAGIKTILYYPSVNEEFYTLANQRALQSDFLISDLREVVSIAN